jgi:hypothetical protein
VSFVPNVTLICIFRQKVGDYCNEMDSNSYVCWLKTLLITNLLPKLVLIIDAASYHIHGDKLPTFYSIRVEMKTPLIEKNILFCDSMLKSQLYDMIKINKPHYRQHLINGILAECGHPVLTLPHYYFLGWLFNVTDSIETV